MKPSCRYRAIDRKYSKPINYDLKVVATLDKLGSAARSKAQRKGYRIPQAIRQTIRLSKENNIRKELARNGVPQTQINTMFNYMKDNNIKEIDTKELAERIANDLSFNIDLNLSLDTPSDYYIQRANNEYYVMDVSDGEPVASFDTKKEAEDFIAYEERHIKPIPSWYYGNLSLDEYNESKDYEYEEYTINVPFDTIATGHFADPNKAGASTIGHMRGYRNLKTGEYTVIEFQSDLFQKGKDRSNLIWLEGGYESQKDADKFNQGDEYKESTLSYSNQFLQFLNKDGKWVRFFIQSIIQSKIDEGYKKIKFPTGTTAAKVEGHNTIENRIKEINKEINLIETGKKYVDKNIGTEYFKEDNKYSAIDHDGYRYTISKKVYDENYQFNDNERQLRQLKEERKHYETSRLEQLAPIEAFYENRVTNILEKDFKDDVQRVTDEFGYQWNEVTVTPEVIEKTDELFFSLDEDGGKLGQEHKEKLFEVARNNGITLQHIDDYKRAYAERTGKELDNDVQAVADLMNETIAYTDSGQVSEELGHFIIAGSRDSYEYKRAMRLVENTELYGGQREQYLEKYNGDETKVREEVLGQIAGEVLNKRFTESKSLINVIKRIWNNFKSLFKKTAKSEVEAIVNEALNNGINKTKQNQLFFSLNPKQTPMEIYTEILKTVDNAIAYRKRKGEYPESLRKAREQFDDNNLKNGLANIVKYFVKDVETVRRLTDKGTISIPRLRDHIDYYDSIIDDLKRIMHNKEIDPDFINQKIKVYKRDTDGKKVLDSNGKPIEEEHKLEDLFYKILRDFDNVKIFFNEQFREYVRNDMIQYAKDNINDPAALEREIEKINKAITSINYDTSTWTYWTGSLKSVTDPISRILHSKMVDVNNKVDNYMYEKGKELVKLAKDLGIKNFSRLREGQNSHYYIQPYHMQKFQDARREFARKMHEKYGLPEDVEERRQVKEDWEKQNDPRLKKYNTEWAKWFTRNTIDKPNADQIIAERKKQLGGKNSPAYKEWESFNILTKDGHRFYRGELVQPSDGRYQNKGPYNKIKTVDYTNNKWNDLTDGEKQFVQKLLDFKLEADQKIPFATELNRLPQVSKSFTESLAKGQFGNITQLLKDMYQKRPDDEEFGEQGTGMEDEEGFVRSHQILRPDGTIAKFVPTRYIQKLDKANDVSDDLLLSTLLYVKMAENLKQKSKMENEFNLILRAMSERNLEKEDTIKLGKETKAYQAVKGFLDAQLYGEVKEDMKVKLPFINKEVNMTKIMTTINNFVRKNNLALNIFTITTGLLSSTTYSAIERWIGKYTNVQSSIRARKIMIEQLAGAMTQTGKAVKTNKLLLMMEKMRVIDGNEDIFKFTDFSQLPRKAITSGLWAGYKEADFSVKSHIMLSIMDTYRFHNGEFKTLQQLEREGVNFKELPTYWDLHEVQNGNIVAKHDGKDITLKLQKKIKEIADRVDGKLSFEDWAAAHRGAITQLITTHRGWLFSGIQNRFKQVGVNYMTGEEEGGYFLTTINVLKNIISERAKGLKMFQAGWEMSTPLEREGFKRSSYQLATTISIYLMTKVILSAFGDDDEEQYALDAFDYQATRLLLELTAFQVVPPTGLTQSAELLNSPIAGTRQMEDLLNLFNFSVLESGPYEGWTRSEKSMYRLIPGIKGLSTLRDPGASNKYLKNMVLDFGL